MSAELRAAEIALDAVDAEIARWFVNDGQLSDDPLGGGELTGHRLEIRDRRLAAVAALEAAGGHDPHPCFTRPPTDAQKHGYADRVSRLEARVRELERALAKTQTAARTTSGHSSPDLEVP